LLSDRVFLLVLLTIYTSFDFNSNQLGMQLTCFKNMSGVKLDGLDIVVVLTYLLIAYFISLDVSRFYECSAELSFVVFR